MNFFQPSDSVDTQLEVLTAVQLAQRRGSSLNFIHALQSKWALIQQEGSFSFLSFRDSLVSEY